VKRLMNVRPSVRLTNTSSMKFVCVYIHTLFSSVSPHKLIIHKSLDHSTL